MYVSTHYLFVSICIYLWILIGTPLLPLSAPFRRQHRCGNVRTTAPCDRCVGCLHRRQSYTCFRIFSKKNLEELEQNATKKLGLRFLRSFSFSWIHFSCVPSNCPGQPCQAWNTAARTSLPAMVSMEVIAMVLVAMVSMEVIAMVLAAMVSMEVTAMVSMEVTAVTNCRHHTGRVGHGMAWMKRSQGATYHHPVVHWVWCNREQPVLNFRKLTWNRPVPQALGGYPHA